MKVTIEKVQNGYLITTGEGQIFVATVLDQSSYTSRGVAVSYVLKEIFEAEPTELKVAA